jgi:hypothetical protein
MLTAVTSESTAQAPPDAPPSADLLRYLGEFEDAEGEFVDPMALEERRELTPGDATTPPPPEDDDRDESAPRSA